MEHVKKVRHLLGFPLEIALNHKTIVLGRWMVVFTHRSCALFRTWIFTLSRQGKCNCFILVIAVFFSFVCVTCHAI